jgi:hypothetical protein
MHKHHHLVKPKHRLVLVKNKLVREHVGFYEERDVQGTFVHWEWLLKHWHHQADLLQQQEHRSRP